MEKLKLNIQLFGTSSDEEADQCYVHCGSHAKHPAYNKNEVDTLLNNKADKVSVINKGDFAIVSCSVPITNANQMINTKVVDYPTGFTKDNAYAISPRYNIGNGWCTKHITVLEGPAYADTLCCYLRETQIAFQGRLPNTETSGTATLEVLLIKKPS